MEAKIHGLQYKKGIQKDDNLRCSINTLAQKTFSLSFESWYQKGYWGSACTPHVLLAGEEVVANVFANEIECNCLGKQQRFVQLGTVMTAEAWRGKGLARFLLETVLAQSLPTCDGVYLYANDTATGLYPKLGFVKAQEQVSRCALLGGQCTAQKLDMHKEEHVRLLLSHYEKGNPYSALFTRKGEGLLMFYCGWFQAENIWFLPEYDLVAIAEQEKETLLCHDLYGNAAAPLGPVLAALAHPETQRVTLGFTPTELSLFNTTPLEEGDTFFWHKAKPNPFLGVPLRFPSLSHA